MSEQDTLKVTLIQSSLHWHDIDANLAMMEEKIWQIGEKTDMIVLPEMFSTGFTNAAPELAEPMNSKTFRWMKQQAKQTKAVVTGSFIAREGKALYNRLLWMRPDGEYTTYDKKHLFRMSEEHEIYSPGEERLVVEWKGWKICPLICYDLRFPVWSRNLKNSDDSLTYDLLVYVANWPAVRSKVWRTLLEARALENLSYCVGLNRVGDDGMNIAYDGQSLAFNYKGEIVADLADQDTIVTATLSKTELDAFRKKFPVYLDADPFQLGE